ncbi:peptidase inhibitor family I36 protein [Streptomyces sp. NBC_00683]|uniref:peptidase inhibitor family I36 protein n=1 Tax=Streptomyces sp. NBC_00683 TaxID=2903670 RepID=UPI002E31FFC6|nr:peptidase inhibitor family I36 protein [Streptomyces sp. NBC_00683]
MSKTISQVPLRRLRTLLIAVISVFAVMLAVPAADAADKDKSINSRPSAAAAAPASVGTLAVPAGCTAGNLCFWVNDNWNDGPGRLYGDNPDWGVYSHSTCQTGTWADCASSVYNNGNSCTATVYYLENYRAPKLTISRQSGYSSLSAVQLGYDDDGNWVPGNWNDNIRSNKWC